MGEGNGNPLQCSFLENPRDGGAWWAAVYGVTQSRTWLKWLSSSSRGDKETMSLTVKAHDFSTCETYKQWKVETWLLRRPSFLKFLELVLATEDDEWGRTDWRGQGKGVYSPRLEPGKLVRIRTWSTIKEQRDSLLWANDCCVVSLLLFTKL